MRRAAWIGLAIVVAVLLVASVVLFLVALGINADDPTKATQHAALIQAFAAAGALAGTAALIGVTGFYAWTTAQILERSGPLVSAKLRQAWISMSGGGALTIPMEKGIASAPPTPGYDHLMFGVEVTNRGGAAVTVEKAAVEMSNGSSFFHPAAVLGTECPYRLDSHSSVTFYVESADVFTAIEVMHQEEKARAAVSLGSGDVVRSGWVITRHEA